MKRWLFFLVPLAAIVVLFVLLLSARTGSNTVTLDEQTLTPEPAANSAAADSDTTTAPAAPGAAASAFDQPAPPADVRIARTVRLADGDSFDIEWLDTGEADEIRLFGINAPEADACFGPAAGGVLQILTDDQDLLVESIERDEFGRVLANVWVDDTFINAAMVEAGAALALSDGGRHADLITNAQQAASTGRVGLWDPAFCGADPGLSLRIDWIEFNAPGPDNENKNGEWIDIVNDGDLEADLTDWSIRDESTRHRFFFPDDFRLGAGDTVRVFSGCGTDNPSELYWCDNDPVWNNGGDTGFLVDPDGRFADSRSYSG